MQKELLFTDGIINLILGIFLLFFPESIIKAMGMPGKAGLFYAGILGGVLLGIGLALLIERFGWPENMTGLGLGGAICINLCGGIVLLIWLLYGELELTVFGLVMLWTLTVILFAISLAELLSYSGKETEGGSKVN